MHSTPLLLALGLVAVTAVSKNSERIVGGSPTKIEEYPYSVVLLYGWMGSFSHYCGGSILNIRSILTAAHCPRGSVVHNSWRVRVGSVYANSGGTVIIPSQAFIHPNYDPSIFDNDIAIMRLASNLIYSDRISPASLAGPGYSVFDNDEVWAIGWGSIYHGGPDSEVLRHVQVKVVNQEICRRRYAEISNIVTENMLCSGLLDIGGRDQCQGDSGSPLLHNKVVVGICSWGFNCANAYFPGVNVRVSRYIPWIQANV